MNWKKILSIITAIAVAVGIVFYFKKSVVSPPQKLKFANEHLNSLQNEASRMRPGLDMGTADSLLYSSLHAARLFQQEGFVSTSEADLIVSQMAQGYVPYFVQTYKRTFENSEWSTRQLSEVRQKAKLLLGLTMETDGKSALSEQQRQQVDSANLILDQYDRAWKLCSQTRFENIEQTEKIIQQARQYAETSPLSNCKTLVKRLYGMREVLETAHLKKLRELVDNQENFRYFPRDYYMKNITERTNNAIKEYKKNAERLYGRVKSTRQLEKDAAEYYNQAVYHYDNNKK